MFRKRTIVLTLLILHCSASSSTEAEGQSDSTPVPATAEQFDYDTTYDLPGDYWLDLNDTFHYPDSYPVYDYEDYDSESSSNVTYESLKKVLPIQLLLDPLYSFLSSNETKPPLESNGGRNESLGGNLLPVPLPLTSEGDKKSLYVNANLNTETSLIKIPGLPISFNDTQTQAFVAVSNTLLLLGSFFALQSLPGRLLGRRRSNVSKRKGNRGPTRIRPRRKKPRPSQNKHRRKKVPKKYRRPPPPPIYYDDEYDSYGYNDFYDYNYPELPLLSRKPEVSLPPAIKSEEYKVISEKKLPPPVPTSSFGSRQGPQIKNIENHQLLPPMIDLNEDQSEEDLHENINKIKTHLVDNSQSRYTTKQTFADTFTRRPDEKQQSPVIEASKVPQLTPKRTVLRKSFKPRARVHIKRRRPLRKVRRKYHLAKHRRPLATRKTRPSRVRSRVNHSYRAYDEDYEEENSGFYYHEGSPFAEDPYARFPELTQWYK